MSVQYRLQITAIGKTPILMELGYYTRLTLSPNPTDWTVSQSTITPCRRSTHWLQVPYTSGSGLNIRTLTSPPNQVGCRVEYFHKTHDIIINIYCTSNWLSVDRISSTVVSFFTWFIWTLWETSVVSVTQLTPTRCIFSRKACNPVTSIHVIIAGRLRRRPKHSLLTGSSDTILSFPELPLTADRNHESILNI